jgi:hypothetical protein
MTHPAHTLEPLRTPAPGLREPSQSVRRRHLVRARLAVRHAVGLTAVIGSGAAVLLRGGGNAILAAAIVLIPTVVVAVRKRDPLAQ